MPREVRRSTRLRGKKNRAKPVTNLSNDTLSDQEGKVESSSSNSEGKTYTCIGCCQKFAPIRRYTITEWIQCDQCDGWWHAECACISVENIKKLNDYEIDYTCAVCILKGSPWIKIDQREIDTKHQNSRSNLSNSTCRKEKKVTFLIDKNEKEVNAGADNIVIVDNLKDSRKFKTSKEIRDKLQEHKKFEKTDYAYSLPRGGIAIHLESSRQVEEVLKEWPEKVFSEGEVPHRPKGQKSTTVTVGYIRNVDIRVRDCDIRLCLENRNCDIDSIKRIYHRHSGKPMPIRKVVFANRESLLVATECKFPFKINGKQAYCEEDRRHRVVRCFNCHRFNHIANDCTFRRKCENCNSEDHSLADGCGERSSCANCGGPHSSSSNCCPKYKQILQNLRLQNMF